ncbi:MAG TPA: BTAD domain-containing putative transcriptional regulator [Nocardioides sp.]|uniref:BTAD domain-containing putative transcriptional regulator n=1 Tax=Nocardioides sp. TaxID=35761 RepID=UPI002E35F448|nr:BTAD domain-containing putative transcriptional regulator [Nocardioides sp.]HEX3932967.1 BTAD domain-containing putative transcriptional regulator [Nocardioides sp.]
MELSPGTRVRVELLGPLELRVDGEPVSAGGPKLRAVLAQLALAGGRVVSVDELLLGVWGEDLPGSARNTLQYHVTTLRKALAEHDAAEAIVTRDPGYALACDTDVAAFLAGATQGERASSGGDHAAAATAYAAALNQWRGQALADLRDFEFGEARAVALEAQRLTCLEAWADAELACGRADALVSPLQDLVTEHPTRERLWEQLMTALYRTGRQDAALSAYQSARIALDRELGVEPTARLVALQRAILNQDSALSPEPAVRRTPARRMTQTVLVRSALSAAPPTLVGPSGQRIPVEAAPVVLGRHEACDVVLVDDEASRRHAQVTSAPGGCQVTDLGSTNGTYLNGVRLEGPALLVDGDRIEIGHSVVRFMARG